MQRIVRILRNFGKKGDLLLLFLCLLATGFGCVVISSATHYLGSSRFLTVQLAATALGVLFYVLLTSMDLEGLAEHRELLFLFNALPTGGAGTHCVLSGHRGLPSAKLFTDLDQLAEGDTFILRILDETLTYEVDQIRTVEPYELDDLGIEEGKDYCTLVTCTPYGINTHRLLVRGRRVDNQPEARTVRVTADAMQIEPVLVAPLVAVPMLFVLLILLLVKTRRKK